MSKNIILRVLDLANKPLEKAYIVAILQRLQYEYYFPLFHTFGKYGYIDSPTIEEDLNDLEMNGDIKIKKGSKILKISEKGRARMKKLSMDQDNLLIIKKVVEDIIKLPLNKVRLTCEKEYFSHIAPNGSV